MAMTDRDARGGFRRPLGVLVVVALAVSLPTFSASTTIYTTAREDAVGEVLAYDERPGERGSGARVNAQVSVVDPPPAPAHSAVSAHAHGDGPGWVYAVTPGVETEGRSGGRVISHGTAVRLGPAHGASTRAVRRELEPFSFADFGDGMILIDRSWVARRIVTEDVPIIGRVRCHEAMIPPLTGALTEIEERGLGHLIDTGDYGGCWVPRRIDWSPNRPLSNHAWGLAIDINVSTNGLGRTPTLDRRIVNVFERWGFAWGGDWRRPDGMHFELVRLLGGNA